MNLNYNEFEKENQSEENTSESAVPENLFVAKDAPMRKEEAADSQGTILTKFLGQNFSRLGYRDGYRYACSDVMDNSLRLIRSEFREIMDHMIEECRETVNQLENQAVELHHISLKAEKKVTIRIGMIKETMAKLEREKEDSSLDEGLNMKVVNQYRDGFLRGVNDNNNELLLMSYNGLFK